MLRNFKNILLYLTLLAPVSVFASGNGTDRGGGDVFAFEFKDAARAAIKRLHTTSLIAIPQLSIKALEQAIETTEVHTLDVVCLSDLKPGETCPAELVRDAINFPLRRVILLNGGRWPAIRASQETRDWLTLHEYASVLRLERNNDVVTRHAIEALRIPLDGHVYEPKPQNRTSPATDVSKSAAEQACQDRCDAGSAFELDRCEALRYPKEREACLRNTGIGRRKYACYERCEFDPGALPVVNPVPVETRGKPLSEECTEAEHARIDHLPVNARIESGSAAFREVLNYLAWAQCRDGDPITGYLDYRRDEGHGLYLASGGNPFIRSHLTWSLSKDEWTVNKAPRGFLKILSPRLIGFYVRNTEANSSAAVFTRWLFQLDTKHRLTLVEQGEVVRFPGTFLDSYDVSVHYFEPGKLTKAEMRTLDQTWPKRKKEIKSVLREQFE